jgi:GLPGLI family protein
VRKLLAAGLILYGLVYCLTSCNHDLFHNRISEGTIEYKIVVLDSANPLAKMAPDKMVVKFKNNIAYADLEAGMGMFQVVFVNNEPAKKLTQMVHIIDKKWAYTADTGVVRKELNHDIQYDITDTAGTKVIAGYNCKKAIAHSRNKKGPDVELYYTNDIQLDQPNWATPFNGVEGVLMQYRISKYGFYMEFTAQKVQPDKIDDNLFKIPPDYKMMSKKDIDDLIKSFQ